MLREGELEDEGVGETYLCLVSPDHRNDEEGDGHNGRCGQGCLGAHTVALWKGGGREGERVKDGWEND